ncbi:multiple sugar transport system permease protein [Saccharothrix ecbatanensis]|uniref:Multiple sugar transport system permease protein n=1 Tax=Saccharothrix ecbatanensis TaxID=1105145 RepID=A0A7W9HIW4_9PSEU|nr:sugar ABC transporter permease [Saccharothrix ecbatanensis]MBB5803119.1 multiple sugar transport system permease protein [Saccharothrix ecbatanensis]
MLAPFFVLFVTTLVVPIGYAAYLSLFTEKASGLGFGGAETLFTGLGNYLHALGDPAFRNGFAVIAGYIVVYIPLMVGGALVLALLLDSTLARAKRFFQLTLYLPHAVPGIIAAIVWLYLYTPGLSPVVSAMRDSGLSWDFLSSDHALSSVVNITLWQWVGYNVVIFYAALQAIPREVVEAASMDGAGQLRTAVSIKLPMIRAAVVMTVLFTIIGALQLFTEPMILHGANPAVNTTWTPNMYAYDAAFRRSDYGVAAAASILIAVGAGLLSFVVTRFGHRKGHS